MEKAHDPARAFIKAGYSRAVRNADISIETTGAGIRPPFSRRKLQDSTCLGRQCCQESVVSFAKEPALSGPRTPYSPEQSRSPRQTVDGPRSGLAHSVWASPATRADVHSQMWRDGLPFGSIVRALQAWVNSEVHVSSVAVDYSRGYRVGIITNQLTRDIMRSLHGSFERLRPRFGCHQPAVYVLGIQSRNEDIVSDGASYIVRRSD